MTHRFKIVYDYASPYFLRIGSIPPERNTMITTLLGDCLDVGKTWVDLKIYGEMTTIIKSPFEPTKHEKTKLQSYITIEFDKGHPFSQLRKGRRYELNATGSFKEGSYNYC
jgi:hypothetical protein